LFNRQELTDDGTDTTALRYTHDAWNRLVKVQFEDEDEDLHPRGEYEYNGLNWRTIRRADTTPADATHALLQQWLRTAAIAKRTRDASSTRARLSLCAQRFRGVGQGGRSRVVLGS
jgi:hypothetical protein